MGICILGMGAYLPDGMADNAYFEKIVETTDEWITTRTGIKARHIETSLLTWQMGEKAAREAIADAGVSPEEIDLVICSTVTSDYLTPSTACFIANSLGLTGNPACFDIGCACAGFVTAVDMAKHYLEDGSRKTALVISTEMLTKMTDYTDRTTCILFGDGAGAAVIRRADAPYVSLLGSDPTGTSRLFARGLAPVNQFRSAPFDWAGDGLEPTNGHGLYQDGKAVYKFATRIMPSLIKTACEKAGISPGELKWVFPHQANLRIIETAAKNLGLPMDKFYVNISDHGNMSSACIPICITEALRKRVLQRGDKICIVGFGAGLVYGAALFDW